VGRKGDADTGHKGSFGFCRWSRTAKRWEWIEGCFKTVAFGVADAILLGDRGTVRLWWKELTAAGAPVVPQDSGMDVEALNYTDEHIRAGSHVTMSFDRQENLWLILGVQYPVHLETTDGLIAELGHAEFDDTDPGVGNAGAFFDIALVAGDEHNVTIGIDTRGQSVASQDMNAAGLKMTFQNGLLVSLT